MSTSSAHALPLSVPRATALYIGALFGPGLLLLPGLAAEQAGPASVIAWIALLGLSALFAAVFAALGKRLPTAAGAARHAPARPVPPAGWLSIGRAASTLTLSFVGWEAVAPLTGRLRAGQLSRVIGIAFTVTAVLYLGLAVATVSCLGRGSDLTVPLADLLQMAIGPAGRALAAVAALVLVAGSVNASLSGATDMLHGLTGASRRRG